MEVVCRGKVCLNEIPSCFIKISDDYRCRCYRGQLTGAKEVFWSRIQVVLAPEIPFWTYKAKYRSADPVQASGLPSQAITYFTPNRATSQIDTGGFLRPAALTKPFRGAFLMTSVRGNGMRCKHVPVPGPSVTWRNQLHGGIR